ncbi:MAG: hypothetical protein N2170_01460 [Bacteroidia bacterium]|nr:hypothetical protein [Bacteroidia bacterium]
MTVSIWVWGGVSALIATGMALWSYHRLPVRVPRPWLYLLGFLRGLGIWALLFLLAEPLWTKSAIREERPRILLLLDNSQSVVWGKYLSLPEYADGVRKIANELRGIGFEPTFYLLDRGIKEGDSLDGKGEASWITAGIQEAIQREKQVSAVVLFSDGQESGEKSASLPTNVPIWTVAIGPPQPIGDARIEAVEGPPWIREGQEIQLRIRLSRLTRPALLRVTASSHNYTLTLPAGAEESQITLKPLPVGVHPIRLRVETNEDPNPANNERMEILHVRNAYPTFVLWAGELTPDIAYLRRTLEQIGPVRLAAARKPTGYTVDPDTLLSQPNALHIWYNFPIRSDDVPLARRILRENHFLLFFGGASSLSPEILNEIGWKKSSVLGSHILPGGVTLYLHDPDVVSSSQLIDVGWGAPIGYKLFRGNRLIVGFLGEGWWRLRENSTLTAQWDSLLRELLQEGLRIQQSRLLFAPERSRISIGEVALWKGWLPEEASLYLRDQKLPIYTKADGLKEAFWTADSPGIYPYTLRQGEKTLLTGYLWVESPPQEMLRIGRDTVTLSYLAHQTGGRFFSWERKDSLPISLRESLPPHTLVSSQRDVIPFHEWSVWLISILLLFSAEWLLRRYVGLY